MSRYDFDAIIVGAGIVGAACAAEFAREGMRVALLDREIVAGSGATAAGMGHIVVMDDSEAQFALTRYSQQLWMELRASLPDDIEFDECGTVWVASDDEEMDEVCRKHNFYRSRGVAAEILSSSELEVCEPNLRKGLAGGLLVPQDGVLYPPCAAHFFVQQARVAGAEIHLGSDVSEAANGVVHTVQGKRFSAPIIINAAGSFARRLTPGLAIRSRKGQLVITDRYPGFVRHQLVELGYLRSAHSVTEDSVAFNVQPRRTGQILIGSSRQFDEPQNREIEAGILGHMLARVIDYMPSLGQLSAIRAWAGFRAATPDKLPLIGPWSQDHSIFLATGHEGLGITTCLATARLLLDQITGRDSAIPTGPYLPSRFVSEQAHA